MNTLELALKAELPLIAITTTDTINLEQVLKYLAPNGLQVEITTNHPQPPLKPAIGAFPCKYMVLNEVLHPMEAYYHWATENEKVLIFVNTDPNDLGNLVFDGGNLPTPEPMVAELLSHAFDPDTVEQIIPTLGGLTLKDVGEVCRLAMTLSGEITPRAIMSIRQMFMTKLVGIEQVNTDTPYYKPDSALEAWASLNKHYFLGDTDPRLVPRGLLAYGKPGTGKTEGGKYLAREWDLPLYRLDIAGMMNKWLGEAEGNLKKALAQAEQEAPCILLLDEIEKLFSTSDSEGGATTRLLAQLLWWMQEHRHKIICILTTNDKDSLPPELYRAGRVDKSLQFNGLARKEGYKYISRLLETFGDLGEPTIDHIHARVLTLWDGNPKKVIPQATISATVYDEIKELHI
ncbi:MAG: AAA family ATPase [Helicobacteraceae bacterium]|nr:AAA family ATPase [Helicobacteraceae bacterium]